MQLVGAQEAAQPLARPYAPRRQGPVMIGQRRIVPARLGVAEEVQASPTHRNRRSRTGASTILAIMASGTTVT